MKTLHRCPKCAGRRIWVIERFRIPGETAAGSPLAVVPDQPVAKASRFSFPNLNPVGRFDLYLCDACGYAELWAEGFRDLVADPARGVRLLDTSDDKAGPFR